MNSQDRHLDREEMLDLIAAYAVHALEPHEIDMVEAHLDDDPFYREELARHILATAALTTEMPVPSTTWESIVAKTRASVDERVSNEERVDTSASEISRPASRPENVIALDAARAGRRLRMRTALVAAVASAAVVAPLAWQFSGGTAPSLAALSARAAKEPGVRSVELKSPEGKVLATVIVTKDGRGYLRQDTLAPLPNGKSYQLWAVTGEVPVSAGVLGRDPGVRAFTVDAPTKAIALSIEPTSGSLQPTSTPIAVGALT